MATYTVQAPDGKTVTLSGPDGASHEQVIAMAQQMYKPQAAQQPAPNTTGAINGEADLGPIGNSIMAAGIHAVHEIPLLGDAGLTAARWARDTLAGQRPTWQQASDETHAIIDSAQQTHPVTSTLGGLVGGGSTAFLGGAGADAALGASKIGRGVQEAMALRNATNLGGHVMNLARLGAAGAVAGGVQGAAQSGGEQIVANPSDPGNALMHAGQGGVFGTLGGAAAGAVGGTLIPPLIKAGVNAFPSAAAAVGKVVGPIGTLAANVTKGLDGKAAQQLAKIFGESPDDLQATWQAFQQKAGRAPMLAELANAKQAGLIEGAAKDSSPIVHALNTAADTSAQARSANMQGIMDGSRPAPGDAFAAQPTTNEPTPVAPAPQGSGPTFAEPPAEPVARPAVVSGQEGINTTTAQGDRDYTAQRGYAHSISGSNGAVTTPATVDAAGNAIPESVTQGGGAHEALSDADYVSGQMLDASGLPKADRVAVRDQVQSGTLSGEYAQKIREGLASNVRSNNTPENRRLLADFDAITTKGSAGEALDQANSNYASNANFGGSRDGPGGVQHGEGILGSETAANYAAKMAAKGNNNPNYASGTAAGARSELADVSATPQGAVNLAQRLATDRSLQAKLSTTIGPDGAAAFQRLGEAETGAATALKRYGSKVVPDEDTTLKDVKTGMQAAAAVMTAHPGWSLYHIARVVQGLGMAKPVQEKVAQYLTDPRMVPAAINILQKAGATNSQLRQLALSAAATAGGVAGGSAAPSPTPGGTP